MALWLSLAALAFVVLYHLLPVLVLRWLTKGRITGRNLMHYEVWDEIRAELKARRLLAEVRRERGARREES